MHQVFILKQKYKIKDYFNNTTIAVKTNKIAKIYSVIFLALVFLIFPQLQFYMKILCFIYLIYLGWKIIGSFSLVKKDTKGRPLKFYEASLFQFINPKAWTIAITVASGFFPTEEKFLVATMFITVTAALVCFPSICIWAIFGNSLRIYIKNEKAKKITEYILAILLVLTAITVLLK